MFITPYITSVGEKERPFYHSFKKRVHPLGSMNVLLMMFCSVVFDISCLKLDNFNLKVALERCASAEIIRIQALRSTIYSQSFPGNVASRCQDWPNCHPLLRLTLETITLYSTRVEWCDKIKPIFTFLQIFWNKWSYTNQDQRPL